MNKDAEPKERIGFKTKEEQGNYETSGSGEQKNCDQNEAKKRYGLQVLNYIVTSNHIHALVYSSEDKKIIPNSLQLIAGRTAQEYNQRKSRKGAFCEDRYHATVVDTDEHLLQCLLYIDLNMVRARVVDHPKDWPHSGYHEIVSPPKRYRIIDRVKLLELLDSQYVNMTHAPVE